MAKKINTEMELRKVKLSDLVPYENNPRNNDEAVPDVEESMVQTGYNSPIVVSKDMVILAGHTRLKSLLDAGVEEAPVVVIDRTAEQYKKFRILDNKTGEKASWDFEKLKFELDGLDFDGFDFGFDFDFDNGKSLEVTEDDFSEDDPINEHSVKRGQIWQLGNHRLMCGDSTDHAAIDRLMDGVKAKLLLTDPPYGISVVSVDKKVGGDKPFGSKGKVGYGQKGKNKILDCNEYAPIIGDDTTDTARANYDVALTCTENQIIFGGNYFTDFLPPSRCWLVWDKQNTGNFADAELAWTSFDKGVKLYHFLWNGLCREGSRKVEGKTRVHPTQKPVGMLADILKDFSEENDSILDCFGGSGSTLIACEQLNRKCYMMELDEHYVDVILSRWEKFTGEKAALLNG